jgi:hypothetical protein
MIRRQIIAIHKPLGAPEHHSAIAEYKFIALDEGGQTYIALRMNMVNWISQDRINHIAFVVDRRGDTATCVVEESPAGNYYLKTRPDGIIADNLLSLPRF